MDLLREKMRLLPLSGPMDSGGGGGGGSPTQSQTTTSELPEWARPYAKDVLAKGQALTDVSQNPYQVYGQPRIAGFSPLQQQAQAGAQALGPTQQTAQASDIAAAAGLGALGTQYQAGRFSGGTFSPFAAQAYMNPYVQASLAPQMELLQRQQGQQAAQMASQATQAGAFGGSRYGLAQAQQNLNNQLAQQNLVGQGYNTAYQQAQQQFNADMARRLQAQQLGEQSRQFGAGLGLQGLQTGLQAAGQLGALGQQQFGQQQGAIQTQAALGGQEQALRQQGLDVAYQDFLNQQNYPYKQLGFMSDLIRGLPLGQQSTAQMYQAPPTPLQSVGALGLGAYGLSKMFAKGGSVADKFTNPEAMLPDMDKLTDEQLQQIVQNPVTPAEGQAAREELAQRASEKGGMSYAFNQLPMQAQQNVIRAAGGGILAFAGDEEDNDPTTGQMVQSRGNPGMYSSLLQQGLEYGKKIGEFKPTEMTPEEEQQYLQRRYDFEKRLAGPNEAAEQFRKYLSTAETDRAAALEQSKGLGALQAASAILQPGGAIRGIGAAGAAFGSEYGKGLQADREMKRQLAMANFNLADAERKERMGFTKGALDSLAKRQQNLQAADKLRLDVLKSQQLGAARLAQAAKPIGGAGGAGKGPKINEQLAAAEIAYENDPSEKNLKNVTALRRAVTQTKTTEVGATKADLTREARISGEDKGVQAAMKAFKYDPVYLEARQAGQDEADRVWNAELERQRGIYRSKSSVPADEQKTPTGKPTRIKFDAQGNVIP